MDTQLQQLQEIIDSSANIVFFGGAGVSTASGIPDFRSVDGLYSQKWNYPPETILSHGFFQSHKEEFYRYYREKILLPEAKPNAAHHKLAELEQAGKLKAVVTQNIDGLHQAAGSKQVLELHGSVHRNPCGRCGKIYPARYVAEETTGIPTCACGGELRPDVVLYEETLDNHVINQAVEAISKAHTLIIGGTSLVVYPAAGFVDMFHGKHLVIINKSPTGRDRQAELALQGDIAEIMGQIQVK